MIPIRGSAPPRLMWALAAVLLLGGGVALALVARGEGEGTPPAAAAPAADAAGDGVRDSAGEPRAGSGGRPTAEAGHDRDRDAERAAGADATLEEEPEPPAAGTDADAGTGSDTEEPASEASDAEPEAQSADPDVGDLLARAERRYASLESLRARFRQEIEVPLLERRREGHGVWLQKGRGRFKMDFIEPPEDVIVADGRYLWLYYPSTNPDQVIRSSLDAPETHAGTADVLARILSEARTNYAADYAGREEVEGVTTHVVELRPEGRSPYRRVTVWIGAEDDLVRRFRIVEENETVRTVTLADLRPDAPVPDSIFRFTPPPEADVFAG